ADLSFITPICTNVFDGEGGLTRSLGSQVERRPIAPANITPPGARRAGIFARGMIEAVRWRGQSGEDVRRPGRHLFLFIGADPNTDWLLGGRHRPRLGGKEGPAPHAAGSETQGLRLDAME